MRLVFISLLVLCLPLEAGAQIPRGQIPGGPIPGGLPSGVPGGLGLPGLGAAAASAARPPPISSLGLPASGPIGALSVPLPTPPLALPSPSVPALGVPAGLAGAIRPLLAGGLDPAEGLLADASTLTQGALTSLRRRTADALLSQHPEAIEPDDIGEPAVRGQVLAMAPSKQALAKARRAGFKVAKRGELKALGLETVTLTPPRGVSAREAVARLRALDPAGEYDFNHLYQVSGAAAAAPARVAPSAAAPAASSAVRIGLIDGSVAEQHPALRSTRISQRLFAPGQGRQTDHATAVASLLVGRSGAFSGAAPGASLWAADVYGSTPAGGSATAIAAALAWLADNKVKVTTISLVGPANRLMEKAVQAYQAHGGLVVAAVGNDGPAAPPLYPAGYEGVVAVTAVDARRRLLPEAGSARHVDFTAPGADMAAAGAAGGYLTVRGTSFAAPLVAGALARRLGAAGPQAALSGAAAAAIDLGAPGPDPVYGRGLIGMDQRIEPASVSARPSLLGGL